MKKSLYGCQDTTWALVENILPFLWIIYYLLHRGQKITSAWLFLVHWQVEFMDSNQYRSKQRRLFWMTVLAYIFQTLFVSNLLHSIYALEPELVVLGLTVFILHVSKTRKPSSIFPRQNCLFPSPRLPAFLCPVAYIHPVYSCCRRRSSGTILLLMSFKSKCFCGHDGTSYGLPPPRILPPRGGLPARSCFAFTPLGGGPVSLTDFVSSRIYANFF